MQDLLYFTTLNEFISFRKECVFCNKSLAPILTNFIGTNRGLKISDINAPLTGNDFVFKLVFHSISVSIEAECGVNIYTNEFTANQSLNFSDFQYLGPHVELQCRNTKCKYNYYISSSIFTSKLQEDIEKKYINTITVDMECFNLHKLWIKNDWISNNTKIFNINSQFSIPIETKMISFDSMEKEKIFNKIKTLVNFS